MNVFGRKKDDKKDRLVFTRETLGVVMILFATLSLVCLITGDKVFSVPGAYIRAFLLGVFGYFSFAITAGLIFAGIYLVVDKKIGLIDKKAKIFVVLLVISVVFLIHSITAREISSLSYGEYLTRCYESGGDISACTFGGILVGLLGYWFSTILSNIGCYVVFGIFTAVFAYAFVKQTVDYNKKGGVSSTSMRTSAVKSEEVQAPSSSEIEETRDYPVSGVDFSNENPSPSSKQKLFVGDGASFALKSKREYKASENSSGLKVDSSSGGLGVARADGSFTKTYGEDMQSKLEYIKTPAKLDLGSKLGGKYGYDVYNRTPVAAQAQSISVSETIPTTSTEDKTSTDTINIPLFEHDESTENESEAAVHAADFADKYAVAESETEIGEFSSSDDGSFDSVAEVSTEVNENDGGKEESFMPFDLAFESSENKSEDVLPSEEDTIDETEDSSIIKDRRIRDIFRSETDESAESAQFGTSRGSFGREQSPIEEDVNVARTSLSGERTRGIDVFRSHETVNPERKVEPTEEEKPKKEKVIAPVNRKYFRPPFDLLSNYSSFNVEPENHEERMEIIKRTLESFHIIVEPENYIQGPTITRYELKMPAGIPVKKVLNFDSDLKMWLSAKDGVRIEAPIPGKNLVGVEVANTHKTTVGLRSVMEGVTKPFKEGSLMFALGKNIIGEAVFDDLSKGPHYLVAGTTGSGKSVCLNIMIVSMIMRYSPEQLRLILVDPKGNEFVPYEHLPHLLTDEIIKDPKRALSALNWAREEMERRYKVLEEAGGIRDIVAYNKSIENDNTKPLMPRIVIIVDELSNLMETCKKDMEPRIISIAQKARAVGIHLVLATQRPSVDVITGLLKANLPSRIALKVTNFADSSTILGGIGGAEKLLGNGDMLYKNSTMGDYERYQGAFISDNEINNIVSYIKEHNKAYFDDDLAEYLEKSEKNESEESNQNVGSIGITGNPENEELLKRALALAVVTGSVSISQLQRRFGIGYNRAGNIIDKMEKLRFISGSEGAKARRVFLTREGFEQQFGVPPENIE